MTRQEKQLAIELEDFIGAWATKQGGHDCTGFRMGFQRELRALVPAVLDAKCHGYRLRDDEN